MSDFDIIWAHKAPTDPISTYRTNFTKTQICTKEFFALTAQDLPKKISGFICGSKYFNLQEAHKSGSCKNLTHLISLISNYRPKFLYFDTPNAILYQRHQQQLEYILRTLDEAGYDVHFQRLNALDYHVPQNRKHVAIIAFRKDIGIKYWFPKTHPRPSTKQVLETLASTAQPVAQPDGIGSDNSHIYLKEELNPKTIQNQSVTTWEGPFSGLQAAYQKIPLHPLSIALHSPRRLTVRECARLQTFPDDFQFQFSNIYDGYKYVADTTPVNLAKHLALSIKRTLESTYWY